MANATASARRTPDPHRIDNILKEDVITSMAIGLLPVPFLDAALLMGLQVTMVRDLCREYGVAFSSQRAVTVVSAVGGAMPVVSILGVSTVVKTVPVIGTVGAGATLALASGAFTYAQGRLLVRHLSRGGTLATYDPRRLRPAFREELEKGRALARALLPQAAARRGRNTGD